MASSDRFAFLNRKDLGIGYPWFSKYIRGEEHKPCIECLATPVQVYDFVKGKGINAIPGTVTSDLILVLPFPMREAPTDNNLQAKQIITFKDFAEASGVEELINIVNYYQRSYPSSTDYKKLYKQIVKNKKSISVESIATRQDIFSRPQTSLDPSVNRRSPLFQQSLQHAPRSSESSFQPISYPVSYVSPHILPNQTYGSVYDPKFQKGINNGLNNNETLSNDANFFNTMRKQGTTNRTLRRKREEEYVSLDNNINNMDIEQKSQSGSWYNPASWTITNKATSLLNHAQSKIYRNTMYIWMNGTTVVDIEKIRKIMDPTFFDIKVPGRSHKYKTPERQGTVMLLLNDEPTKIKIYLFVPSSPSEKCGFWFIFPYKTPLSNLQHLFQRVQAEQKQELFAACGECNADGSYTEEARDTDKTIHQINQAIYEVEEEMNSQLERIKLTATERRESLKLERRAQIDRAIQQGKIPYTTNPDFSYQLVIDNTNAF